MRFKIGRFKIGRFGIGLVVVLALAGCGKPATVAAPPPQPKCTGDEVAAPSGCVLVDPQAGPRSNREYRKYKPVPPAAKAAADEVAARVPAVLKAIQAGPAVTEESVLTALREKFPGQVVQSSAKAAGIPAGIGYGIEVSGACVHGWVADSDQGVEVHGQSLDGGCLAQLGH